MEQYLLPGSSAKIVVKDNVVAVISNTPLTTISSGIYNGGFKKVHAILNVSVPDDYNDNHLHDDPLNLIYAAQKNLQITPNCVAMLTAAKIKNLSLVTRQTDDITILAIATAGWRHGESAGEVIENSHYVRGTINVIVVINADSTDSCLASLFLTATEAKTAAMNDYDIRSRYSGDVATGTITDSLSIAVTGQGAKVEFGGPASNVGQLVASAVRQVVKEAADKQEGQHQGRTLNRRLSERHLSLDCLAVELSKAKVFGDQKTIISLLEQILASDPVSAVFLLAAARLDDDFKKGLIPNELGDISLLSKRFGCLRFNQKLVMNRFSEVNLPPFTKQAVIAILQNSLSKNC
ncbi:MAG: adenosylcobinamide amidohydrolase [Candidatus Bathyarchaeota archaeon]|uniref:adenosylcobinamide amidohydrolase n=1 Tax=Candidatus Bathycorpusculum sp. TaxID=2994959 RepID=UPI00281A4B6A|nr:adenosylcobinamide amidohydrolase [Candidatus Termiticorpusculum sp.]MCL2256821.1 adenosylcobinamide amidohydrolase [Candidatus Termiticorpusculum sp.]MCL2293100.1 adenosylcobinamide amidohydrolase [Candidatus Termiticorpusculum sp.]